MKSNKAFKVAAEAKFQIPTEADVNGWINDLFSPVASGKEQEQYKRAMFAFEELVGFFIYMGLANQSQDLLAKITKQVRVNATALTSMLKKFQRDVYGVQGFRAYVKDLVLRRKLVTLTKDKVKAEEELMERVCDLGLRISAENPRKTRVAAAFSLWMCVYRPVYIDGDGLDLHSNDLDLFCASFNYWLASTFLMKFGEVSLGKGKAEADIRMGRVRHDFTVRQVCLSTLETFYSAIFRPTDKE